MLTRSINVTIGTKRSAEIFAADRGWVLSITETRGPVGIAGPPYLGKSLTFDYHRDYE